MFRTVVDDLSNQLIELKVEEDQEIGPGLDFPKSGSARPVRSLDLYRSSVLPISDISVYSGAAPRSEGDAKDLGGNDFSNITDQLSIECEVDTRDRIVIPHAIASINKFLDYGRKFEKQRDVLG